jgi:hypothetical protein
MMSEDVELEVQSPERIYCTMEEDSGFSIKEFSV